MAKLLKLRRGSTSQHSSFTGAEGEVTIDTDKDVPVVHDGSTAGGHPVAAEDMANVSSASIVGRIGTSALAGTKVSPDFGSQNISTTGTIGSSNITITNTQPFISLQDSDNENDFEVGNAGGTFRVRDVDAGVNRLTIDSSGTAGFSGNLDVGAGIDVTGNATVSGNLSSGDITISDVSPSITFTDSNDNPDFSIFANTGELKFNDVTNSTVRMKIESNGTVDVSGNLDVGAGVDVTGNITATGTASTGQITAKGTQEPQIIVQDSDSGHTGTSAETGISFRDGGGTQQSMIGHNNSGDKDFYLDTAGADHRINFRVGGSTTQLEIESGAVNVTGNITVSGTVDGRDVAADGTKLDAITTGNAGEIPGNAALAN